MKWQIQTYSVANWRNDRFRAMTLEKSPSTRYTSYTCSQWRRFMAYTKEKGSELVLAVGNYIRPVTINKQDTLRFLASEDINAFPHFSFQINDVSKEIDTLYIWLDSSVTPMGYEVGMHNEGLVLFGWIIVLHQPACQFRHQLCYPSSSSQVLYPCHYLSYHNSTYVAI